MQCIWLLLTTRSFSTYEIIIQKLLTCLTWDFEGKICQIFKPRVARTSTSFVIDGLWATFTQIEHNCNFTFHHLCDVWFPLMAIFMFFRYVESKSCKFQPDFPRNLWKCYNQTWKGNKYLAPKWNVIPWKSKNCC